MLLQDVERIARVVLRELGAGDRPMTIASDGQPDRWRIEIGGVSPATLTVRAGTGTTASHVREQILTQFSAR